MFKRNYVKITALILSIILMAGLFGGCGASSTTTTGTSGTTAGSTTSKDDKVVVGAILNHTQDVFMKNLESGFLNEAKNYPNLELKLVESGMDPAKQLSQVEQFISEKVDIIVLNPANLEASATAVEEAVEAGIPIFTVNTKTTAAAQEKCITYVGSDAVESGEIQTKYVAEEVLKGKGKIAYMNATMGHEAQINRKEGTMNILKNFPDIEIVVEGAADWSTEKAVSLTENWLQSGKEFDIIVCQGADMALGAVLALKDAGKLDEIMVSGIDISTETAKELMDGNLTNLVFQDAIGQGATAVKTAMAIANGETVDKVINIPYELVTKDNCSDYDGRY